MNSKLISKFVLAMGAFLLGGILCAAEPASSWKVTFSHKAGKSAVDFSSSAKMQALAELDNIVAVAKERKVSRIEVRSYSSPEGKLSWNTKLADLRSDGVIQLLEEKLAGMEYPQIEVNNVPEDWESAKTYLRLTDKPWKEEALRIINSADDSRKEKMEDLWAGEAWDDLLWNCFYAVRRTEVIITFESNSEISETSEPASVQDYSIKFPVGSTSVAGSYLDNASNLKALKSLANTAEAGKTIVLDAYSSPEGRASWNLVLARRRAESVKAYLVSLGAPAERIEIRTIQEDWAGLGQIVEDSWFGTEKSEILDIIGDTSLESNAKESKLKELGNGQVWNRLIASWMTGLRRVDIHLE